MVHKPDDGRLEVRLGAQPAGCASGLIQRFRLWLRGRLAADSTGTIAEDDLGEQQQSANGEEHCADGMLNKDRQIAS